MRHQNELTRLLLGSWLKSYQALAKHGSGLNAEQAKTLKVVLEEANAKDPFVQVINILAQHIIDQEGGTKPKGKK